MPTITSPILKLSFFPVRPACFRHRGRTGRSINSSLAKYYNERGWIFDPPMPDYHEGGENGNIFQSRRVVLHFQFERRRLVLLRDLRSYGDQQDEPNIFRFQLFGPDRFLYLRNLRQEFREFQRPDDLPSDQHHDQHQLLSDLRQDAFGLVVGIESLVRRNDHDGERLDLQHQLGSLTPKRRGRESPHTTRPHTTRT